MHRHALYLLRTISRSESESLPLFAPITILACGWVCGAHRMRRCAWPASSTVTLIGRSGRHNGPRPQSSCQLPVGRPLAAASGRHWHCIHWQLKLKPGPTSQPTATLALPKPPQCPGTRAAVSAPPRAWTRDSDSPRRRHAPRQGGVTVPRWHGAAVMGHHGCGPRPGPPRNVN